MSAWGAELARGNLAMEGGGATANAALEAGLDLVKVRVLPVPVDAVLSMDSEMR